MYVYQKKKNKKINNKLSLFYKTYFFSSLILLLFSSLIFFNTGIWKSEKENILNRVYVNGLNNYLNIFSIAYQIIKYSNVGVEEINININFEEFLALEQDRRKIISNSVAKMRSLDHSFASAKGSIENNKGDKFKINVRLKGDRITHYEKNRASYKIDIRKDQNFLGLRKFSLIKPRARNYIHEWIFHELIGEENLIKLKYNFVNLKINGENNGLYVLEEGFDKILVERNGRRNGPIFSMREEFSNNINLAQFDLYNKSFWNKTENIEIVSIAQNKLEKFFSGNLQAKSVLDLDKWFWYFAVADLTYTHHGLSPRNVKFFYNTLSGLFEPIGYDGHRILPNFDTNLKNFNHQNSFDRATSCINECSNDDEVAHFLYKIFYNQNNEINKENYTLYRNKVAKISNKDFLKDFFEIRKDQIELLNSKIYSDYFLIDNTPYVKYGPGIYYFSFDDVYYRAKKLRSKIKYKISKLNIIESHDKIKFINNNEINNYSLKIVELFCYGNDSHNSYENQINLSLNLNYNFFKPKVFYKNQPEYKDAQNCYKAKLNDEALNESFLINIDYFNDTRITKKDNSKFKKFFTISNKILKLKNSETLINEDLYIPSGFKVKIYPSEKIFLINHSIIFSESPWEIGSKSGEKVYIGGLKNNFGGGIIIKTNQETSVIDNSNFEYLYGTKNRFLKFNEYYFTIKSAYLENNKYSLVKNKKIKISGTNNFLQGFNYVGALNFYNSKVKITNSMFSKIKAEDAINIISSEFKIQNTDFDSIDSDAIDIDFSSGSFNNLTFKNIGNDALDFSGSIISIKKIKFDNIGDKSISLGENTSAYIDDVIGTSIFCGIAAKDGSVVEAKNINFKNIKIPFASYNKKTFYDPPVLILNEKISVKNFKKMYLKDINSKIIVKKKNINEISKNVFKIIYNKNLELL
jgi:hypothetical protein